jgi:hypothetical protein
MEYRKRTLVAIGTHDLDTLQGPFSYEVIFYHCFMFVITLCLCVPYAVSFCNLLFENQIHVSCYGGVVEIF